MASSLSHAVVVSIALCMTYEQQLEQRFSTGTCARGACTLKATARSTRRCDVSRSDLTELDVDYAIAGGMALLLAWLSTIHGRRRRAGHAAKVWHRFTKQLEGLGYVRPFAASKNLRDAETGVRIDFIISGQYPGDGKPGPIAFPDSARRRRSSRMAFESLSLPKLIELKLASGQASHRLKDLGDVQELIQHLKLAAGICGSIGS